MKIFLVIIIFIVGSVFTCSLLYVVSCLTYKYADKYHINEPFEQWFIHNGYSLAVTLSGIFWPLALIVIIIYLLTMIARHYIVNIFIKS